MNFATTSTFCGRNSPHRSFVCLPFGVFLLVALVGGCGTDDEDDPTDGSAPQCTEDFDCQQSGFTEGYCSEQGFCVDQSRGCDSTQCNSGCTDGCPMYPQCDSDSICQERSTSEYCYDGVCIDCSGPCYGDGPCACVDGDATSETDAGETDAADTGIDSAAVECETSGGTVSTASCCASSEAFPDLCSVGACGCADEDSVELAVCDCGEGRCFNGTTCVDSM